MEFDELISWKCAKQEIKSFPLIPSSYFSLTAKNRFKID